MACAFAFAFVLASGEQGFDCSPLAGLRPAASGNQGLSGGSLAQGRAFVFAWGFGFCRLSGCAFFLRP